MGFGDSRLSRVFHTYLTPVILLTTALSSRIRKRCTEHGPLGPHVSNIPRGAAHPGQLQKRRKSSPTPGDWFQNECYAKGSSHLYLALSPPDTPCSKTSLYHQKSAYCPTIASYRHLTPIPFCAGGWLTERCLRAVVSGFSQVADTCRWTPLLGLAPERGPCFLF